MPRKIKNVDGRYRFSNVHGNYSEKYKARVRLYNDPAKNGFDAYNEVTEDIKALIKIGLASKIRIRACGSRWSLSKAPYAHGMLIFSVNEQNQPDMKFRGFLNNTYLEAPGDTNEFLFAQCGNTIKDLNAYCEKAERSLPTSGASNGQTIVGAMSTGVNGSAINVGCVQDYIVGLHIVKGDGPSDSVYLEPENVPIVNQKFVDKIQATIIRDDDLFYSALVSLGAFGYIHGVMIQTEPLFALANTIKKVDLSDAFKYTNSGTIRNTVLKVPGFNTTDLYHLKFYINQYDYTNNVRAEIIYKLPAGDRGFTPLLDYIKDIPLKAVKLLTTIAPNLIPKQINKRLPKDGESEVGYLGEIFSDTTNLRRGQFACAIAVDISDTERVTTLMLDHFKKPGVKKIPSVLSFRFVKKSKAILAFTKFDHNCVIGFDGIDNKHTQTYLKAITQILIDSRIPHTWHWGKHNYMNAAFVQHMYRDQVNLWRNKRQAFLSNEVADAFASEYLDNLGLTIRFV